MLLWRNILLFSIVSIRAQALKVAHHLKIALETQIKDN